MENPYTLGEEERQWLNATAFVHSYLKFRWLWFERTGLLWSSRERIVAYHRYPRDYVLPVLERYVRRYGYVPDSFFLEAYRRIEERLNFYSKAHRHYPDMRKYGSYPDGPCTYVCFEKPADCPFCGSPGKYHFMPVPYLDTGEGFPSPGWRMLRAGSDQEDRELSMRYRPGANHVKVRCSQSECARVLKFVQGKHELNELAKKLNVIRKVPLKEIKKSQTQGEAFLRAAAAMVDFEARVFEKSPAPFSEGD